MTRLGRLRLRLRWQHWLLLIGLGLATYFGAHAVHGDRGWMAWRERSQELAAAETRLAALQDERRQLEKKVEGLRPDALDPDLIDELARESLSLVDPMDVIVLLEGPEHQQR